MSNIEKRYDTAEKRWAGIGPYYAMFPASFADEVIQEYTKAGDIVLDPFAGRATAIYSAAIQGRIGIGIELNPVGWVYGKAKLWPAKEKDVEIRLKQLAKEALKYSQAARQMPEFFHYCFNYEVRKFLAAAREQLSWKRRVVDWTTMALLLVYLHGKREDSLSNQMRQTKSMSPQYAIRWWKERNLTPPELDPLEFMLKRIKWRYAKGRPETSLSQVYLGDSNEVLPRLNNSLNRKGIEPIRLLFTSPPYYGVTNYHYDQWLRLWLLGFPPTASYKHGRNRGRFNNRDEYQNLLFQVFSKASQFMSRKAIVYVRTDGRNFTYQTTLRVLREVFPKKKVSQIEQPFHQPTQTHLFGDHTTKAGEIDLVLIP